MAVTVVGGLDEDVLVRVARLPGRGETAAALSTTGPGARGALPSAAEVETALGRTPAAEPVG